jgi:uncharacterized integral membrane protein
VLYKVISNKYFYLLANLSQEEKFKALEKSQGEKFKVLRHVSEGGIRANKWLLVMVGVLLFILIVLFIHKYISKNKD